MTASQVAQSAGWMPSGQRRIGVRLCNDPPVFYFSALPQSFETAARTAANVPQQCVCFIVGTASSLDSGARMRRLRGAYRKLTASCSNATIIVATNSYGDLRRLARRGIHAVFANPGMFVDEDVFRPRPEIEPEFDAVISGSVSAKEWHLLRDIETKLRSRKPNGPQCPKEASAVLAQFRVGLCLSNDVEAVTASIECLLAGLPIVTVPLSPGEDRYFDIDTAIKVHPDPRQIRDCVAMLKARNMPRDYVRSRTLNVIKRDRERFSRFVDGLREELIRVKSRSSLRH